MNPVRQGIRGLFMLSLFAALSSNASAALSATAPEAEEAAFLEWVVETAMPISEGSNGEPVRTDWTTLDTLLTGKRIISLGTSDHWVQQKYEYRLALIRHLFSAGWRYIGMEMDFADGIRVDRYLDSGNEIHLDLVALYGYAGGRRVDRDDLPIGFPGMNNPEFRKAFRADEFSFLAGLRELNASLPNDEQRLRWFGYDLGLLPGVGIEEARSRISGLPSGTLRDDLHLRLADVPGETRVEQAARLEELLFHLTGEAAEAVEGLLGPAHANELRKLVRHEADALRFREAAHEGPRSRSWIKALIDREKAMSERLDMILAELPPDARVILLGHNLHLNKESERIRLGPAESSAPTLWTTIGTVLNRRYPDQVLAIWMTYDRGRHGTVLEDSGVAAVASTPGTIESLLAKCGRAFHLQLASEDPRAGYLSKERNFLQNGSVAATRLREQADVLVFFPEASALGGR